MFGNLKKIFKCSLKIIMIISLISTSIGMIFSNVLASFFAEKGTEIYEMSSSGLRIFSIAFLFMGINIYASGMFTAYSNGKISAFISIIRTLVLISSALVILPKYLGITGVWVAIPIAEFITIFISFALFKRYQVKYMYGKNAQVAIQKSNSDNLIITLNRTFGSGGKEVAKRVADKLNIAFYDEEIINDVLNEEGFKDEYLEKYSDVNFTKNYDFKFATSFSKYNQSMVSDVYEKRSNVIKELAKLQDCIFVGNCADYVLKDEKTFNIYIHAKDEKYILDRLYEKNRKDKDVSSKELFEKAVKVEENRKKYYEYYTDRKAEDINNYDIVLDVSKFGINESVDIINEAINVERELENGKKTRI